MDWEPECIPRRIPFIVDLAGVHGLANTKAVFLRRFPSHPIPVRCCGAHSDGGGVQQFKIAFYRVQRGALSGALLIMNAPLIFCSHTKKSALTADGWLAYKNSARLRAAHITGNECRWRLLTSERKRRRCAQTTDAPINAQAVGFRARSIYSTCPWAYESCSLGWIIEWKSSTTSDWKLPLLFLGS